MKAQPLDSFTAICKTMSDAGYMKSWGEVMSPLKESLHRAYRIFTIFVLVIFDLQHIIFIFQVLNNIDLIVASLFTLIITLNATFKLIIIYFNTHRFEQLRDVINCPLFKSDSSQEEELLKNNERLMNMLLTISKQSVILCMAFWFAAPFINRMVHGVYILPFFVPFSTAPITGFSIAVTYHTTILIWTGIGNMTCDCFIAALYSHSSVQLKIIRLKLEHFADDDENCVIGFRDVRNTEIRKRFLHCVQRYEMVIKFTMDVQNILSSTVFMQFFCSAGVICMTVYELSTLASALSAQFIYMSIYLALLLVQLYLYCHFGTMIEYELFPKSLEVQSAYESQLINQSIYQSDWVSLSPMFRRQMLIAMTRWSEPITLLAANIAPLSLKTFIRVLRIAYTLYTVLKASKKS